MENLFPCNNTDYFYNKILKEKKVKNIFTTGNSFNFIFYIKKLL